VCDGIDLDQVDYQIADADRPEAEQRWTCRKLTTRLAAGQITAIVGRTGSGKSTIANLLLGLATPQSGQIRIDGRTWKT